MKDQLNLQDHVETNKNLLKLIKNEKLTVKQVNGQRIVNGPPEDWEGPPPDPGCEIFVGKIPRDIYEDRLYEIFRKFGQIYELRLMMEFSGNTRGFAFILYSKKEEADRAIDHLNNFEISPDRRIGVVKSTNNCRLCLGQLPSDISPIAIIRKIFSITDEIDTVAVYRNHRGRTRYALLNYKSHRGAAMARRILVPDRAILFGDCQIKVDWAHPAMQPYNLIEDIGFIDKNGEVHIKTSAIGGEGKRTFASISKNRKETLDRKIKTYVLEDRSLPLKQSKKVISAQDCPKLKNQSFIQPFAKPLDMEKSQLFPAFNLFDEFTFSLSNQEDQGSAGSLEQLRSQNERRRLRIADSFKIIDPDSTMREKVISSFSTSGYQSVVWPEKGFPFLQPPPTNIFPSVPFVHTQIPGFCIIPSQSPYIDSWPMDNRSYYGCNQNPTGCLDCFEEYEYRAHQNFHLSEAECSEYLAQFKGRKQKQREIFNNSKPVRKIPSNVRMNPRRKNNSANHDTTKESSFLCKPTPPAPIPKGARPILCAKK